MALIVADEVAERLDDDQVRMLRAGELATHPEYQCGQPGNLTQERARRQILAVSWQTPRSPPL